MENDVIQTHADGQLPQGEKFTKNTSGSAELLKDTLAYPIQKTFGYDQIIKFVTGPIQSRTKGTPELEKVHEPTVFMPGEMTPPETSQV